MLAADFELDRRDFAVRAAVSVAPGERLALFGPSGAGKTTLLEIIAGLVRPRSGKVVLGGRVLTSTVPPVAAVPPWQRRVGLLRQDPGLFPHLTAGGNLRYAIAPDAASAQVAELAAALGIGGLLTVMPARLSGGQAHRVALGRLLAAPCDALLLDEPYAGLDASLRRSLTDLVIGLTAQRQVPSILVTHELADAQAFGHRLMVLDQGQLLQDAGPGEVVLAPASRRVAELVGYLGFIPVRRGDAGAGTGVGTVAGPGDPARIVAGIHPERVTAGAHPDRGVVLTGTVTGGRPAGAGWETDLDVAGTVITCRLPARPGSGELAVTALDPPCFGPDGSALPPGKRPAGWPVQVRA